MGDGGEDSALVQVHLLGLPVQARLRFSQHLQDLTRELSLVQIGAQQRPQMSLPPRLLHIAAELNGPYAAFRAAPDAVVQEALARGQDYCDVTYTVPLSAGAFLQRLGEVLEEADHFCRGQADLLLLPATQEVVAYRHWIVGESSRQLLGQAPRPWRAHPYSHTHLPTSPTTPATQNYATPTASPAPAPAHPVPPPPLTPSPTPEPGPSPAPAPVGSINLRPAPPGALRPPLVMESMASSVAAARRYVREVLDELGAQELEESAELGVSELVTNAVLHAQSTFTLSVLQRAGSRVRIGVSDTSPFPLQPRQFTTTATTGRGLQLVASLSFDWGVHELPTGGPGKTVWFEPRALDTEASLIGQNWSIDLDTFS